MALTQTVITLMEDTTALVKRAIRETPAPRMVVEVCLSSTVVLLNIFSPINYILLNVHDKLFLYVKCYGSKHRKITKPLTAP